MDYGQKLIDIYEMVYTPWWQTSWFYWCVLIFCCFLILGVIVAFWYFKKKKGEGRAGYDPMKRLEATQPLIDKGISNEFYHEVVLLVKSSFAKTFNFSDQGKTDTQIMSYIDELAISPDIKRTVVGLFRTAEKARFASVRIESDVMKEDFDQCKQLIMHLLEHVAQSQTAELK